MYKIDSTVTEPTLLKIPSISDDRGYLVPITDDIDHDLFRRCYVVGDYGTGVVRGLHYHKIEAKIFTIASGAAKFQTLKLPEDMADRNDKDEIRDYAWNNPDSVKTFIMSDRHHAVLYVPPFYANGWISLEDRTVLTSLSSLRFEEAKDDDLRISPYVIDWNVIGR